MLYRRVIPLLVLLLLLSQAPFGQAQDTLPVPRFEPDECPVAIPEGHTADCGYLVVLEDRSNPTGATIRLPAAIFKATGPTPAPDAIVFPTPGGPGGSSFGVMEGLMDDFAPFMEAHDFVLVEQRGTSYAQPALNCPEIDTVRFENYSRDLGRDAEIALEVEAAQLCRDRLIGEGINLAAYNTTESAADLEDLRQVLGYDTWNLYGVSYAAHLTMATMRDHPAGLRSVILDSVYNPVTNLYEERVGMVARAIETMVADCMASPDCAAAYPTLAEDFVTLIATVNANPLELQIPHPETGEPVSMLLTGDDLVSGLADAMKVASSLPLLPYAISQLSQGDLSITQTLAEEGFSDIYDFATGMQLSVECQEEYPFNDEQAVLASSSQHPELAAIVTEAMGDIAICKIWGLDARPLEHQPIHSDVPALILAGQYDPITPPASGQLAAEWLPNSFYFEFPGLSHATMLAGRACPRNIGLAFIENPTQEPDGSCISELRSPGFIAFGTR